MIASGPGAVTAAAGAGLAGFAVGEDCAWRAGRAYRQRLYRYEARGE
jgi:hypothetical protein